MVTPRIECKRRCKRPFSLREHTILLLEILIVLVAFSLINVFANSFGRLALLLDYKHCSEGGGGIV